jgi:DNA ligase (NAD+)
MIKGDGLTTKLVYKSYDGITAELVEASTRGNGVEGSLITHNAKTFNIPLRVNYGKNFTVVGESVILKNELDRINASLPEEDKYANCRNLASGSLSLLDSSECAKRHIHFMAFDVIEGMDDVNSLYERFNILESLGFEVIYHMRTGNMGMEETPDIISMVHKYADDNGIPCDGVVIRYDDYAYGTSLGRTSHHYNYGLAKKEKDDLVETVFRGIEWNTSRNGIVTPTGLFDEIFILDSQVSRATLHNLDYINNLKLRIGDRICCSKRNMVIPAIEVNLDYNSENYQLPIIDKCPSCDTELVIKNTGTANVLYCPNESCPSRGLAKFTHFVSKNCMDIRGLSEKTLETLISHDFLHTYKDIYHLLEYRQTLVRIERMGEKSVSTLLKNIEKSRSIKLENFLNAIGISDVGIGVSKIISDAFNGDFDAFYKAFKNHYNWADLQGVGSTIASNISKYLAENEEEIVDLASEMRFVVQKKIEVKENPFIGKTLCVTGKLNHFTRDSINAKIAELGAKAASSVSSKTDYLITNEQSGSSKYKKAVELNISIITEAELLEMIG